MNLLVLKNFDNRYSPLANEKAAIWLMSLPAMVSAVPIIYSPEVLNVALNLGNYNPDYVILLGDGREERNYTTQEEVLQGRPRKVLSLPHPDHADTERVAAAIARFSELLEIEYGNHAESIRS